MFPSTLWAEPNGEGEALNDIMAAVCVDMQTWLAVCWVLL